MEIQRVLTKKSKNCLPKAISNYVAKATKAVTVRRHLCKFG